MEQPAKDQAVLDAQLDHWNSIAPAWQTWWPVIEAGAQPVSELLMDLAAIRDGDRVLDLASGIGEPAATAAQRVGLTGHVVATDLAPFMVEQGRKRARMLGLENLEFRLMDASEPDLPPASFDVLLCRWGLMFLPNLEASLTRLRALLKPGGRLAVAVWGPPEKVPAISLGARILSRELDLPPPGEDEPTPFDLADIDDLERRLSAIGFINFRCKPVTVVYEFGSSDAFLTYRKELSRIDQQLGHIDAGRREAAWGAVVDALEPYRQPDERIVMENLSLCLGCELS